MTRRRLALAIAAILLAVAAVLDVQQERATQRFWNAVALDYGCN